MAEPTNVIESQDDDLSGWDFAGTRRHHLELGLRMTPAERLQWLEETVDEMRRLQGLAREQPLSVGRARGTAETADERPIRVMREEIAAALRSGGHGEAK